jgi:hypothetical protein
LNGYRQEKFKKLKVIHQEFHYACFHPLSESLLITLEEEQYPIGCIINEMVDPEEEVKYNV